MGEVRAYQYYEIPAEEIRSTNLRQDLEQDSFELNDPTIPAVECAFGFTRRQGFESFEGMAFEVIYYPQVNRAGIAWGGDAVWTDANSIENALDRFFELNGCEVSP